MSDDIAQIVILSMSETALLYRRVRTLHNLGLDVALTTRRWVKLDRKYSCQLLNVERPNSRNETEGTHAAFSLNECPIWFVQSGGQSVQSIANTGLKFLRQGIQPSIPPSRRTVSDGQR